MIKINIHLLMINLSTFIIVTLTLLCVVQSKIGYALFKATTDATYACFSQKSGTFAIPQAYNSYGGLNQNVLQNLKLAKNRGFETDIYMFSCPGKDPYQQVEEMTNGVPNDLYNTVWLRVSNNTSPGCSWYSNPPQKNCQFLRSLVNGVQAKGKNVGILSTIYDWNATFKNVSSCPQVATVPLMYGSNDGVASLSGFVAFGGWKTPAAKEYIYSAFVCNQTVSLIFKP